MPPSRRCSVSLKGEPALRATRALVDNDKLVYVLVASKPREYGPKKRKSRIMYIGTTKNGEERIATSAATRADSILGCHGVKAFEVRIVTCTPLQRVKTWFKLEKALLIRFRNLFGTLPMCNDKNKNSSNDDDSLNYFNPKTLDAVLEKLSTPAT